MKLPLNQITISNRQRTEFDDEKLSKLADSITAIGLIYPVIVDEDNNLIDGECRIRAYRLLGRTEIEIRLFSDLTPWEKEVMELEANIRRIELPYTDRYRAIKKLHQGLIEQHGNVQTLGGTGRRKWSDYDTAQLLGISTGALSQTLRLANAIEKDPTLGELKTESQARNAMLRKQEIVARQLLTMLKSSTRKPEESVDETGFEELTIGQIRIVKADCLQLIKSLPNESVSCLITDPPWQVDYDETFGSDKDIGLELTELMLKELYPKLQIGSLCWLFCASKHLMKGTIYRLILDSGYRCYEQFLIWYKPRVAHTSQPYRSLKNDYEPCLLFSKDAGRNFSRPLYAVQEATIKGNRIHPAQKPLEVLETIIEVSTVSGETIIDPFCGSGSTGVATKRMGRKAILVDKDDRWYSTAVMEVSK